MILIILVTVFSSPGLLAQVPDGFNYQAIARDETTGEPLQNTLLNVRIAILSSINPDVVVWEEGHSLYSNEFGLFTLQVGDPSASYVDGSAGSFAAIDWTSGSYYIRPSVMKSGASWQVMTPSKLIAVPFAMMARDVENKQEISKSGDFILLTEGGSVDLSAYVDPDQTIELDGTTLSISGSGSSVDLSAFLNPDQTLGLTGNNLTISGSGSSVDLSGFIDPKQNISKSGNTVTLDGNGGSFSLGEYVNQFDADADTLTKSDGSLVLGPDNAQGSILKVVGSEVDPVAPLFEVKNQAGQQVFAVYDNGVQIHVDDISTEKGSRGGFAVAGFDRDKAPGNSQDFLLITPDSVRMFIPETTAAVKAPGSRGGFAVGGFDADKKAPTSLYFNVSGRNEVDIYSDVAQMLWYPQKEAFQAGRINIPHSDSVGLNSTAFGYHPMAKGAFSQAFGNQAKATGDNSTAIGNKSVARGYDSYAFGSSAQALGEKSFALGSIGVDSLGNPMGQPTTASGDYSMAMGMSSVASERGSLALGVDSYSSGWYSTALGYRSIASGSYSNAFGLRANSTGSYSMALGMYSYAKGLYSLALGSRATAEGQYSIAVGYYSRVLGDYAVGLGYNAQADANYSYAMGRDALSEGLYSFALGNQANSVGQAAYALGNRASADADYSYALGNSSTAGAIYAYALGYNATAGGSSSYALGNGAQATQSYSYALGYGSSATNSYAIALGTNSTASGQYGTAIGRAAAASNTVSTAIGFSALASGYGGTAIGLYSKAIGDYSNALGWYAEAQKPYSVAIGLAAVANGDYAFAIGRGALSTANNATSLGYNARAQAENAYAFGTNALSSGVASVTLGYQNTASVANAIAIGNLNTSNGQNAVSFGSSNTSSGNYSIAIGSSSTATADYSNALGYTANASGARSTAIGYETSAQGYKSVSMGANYYKNLLIYNPPFSSLTKSSYPSTVKAPDGGGEVMPGEGGEEPAGTKQFIILPLIIDRDNDALDSYSVAIGGGNLSDQGGFTFGVYNDATEEYATAIGFANKATGLYSTAIGFANAAEGVNSTALGKYTTAESYNSIALGTYNYLSPSYTTDEWVETDPLLQVGNGTSSSPNDAFVIYKNGKAYHEARDAQDGVYVFNEATTRTSSTYGLRSYLYNRTSATTYGVYSYAYGYSTSTGSIYSGYFTSYNAGTGENRGLYATLRTGAKSDLAEYIYDNNRETEAADVVVADENGKENIVKSTKPYQSSVVGIVSTDPHLLMGTELVLDEESGEDIEGVSAAKLALAGRVPCKVTDENGSIKPGDMLTSSSTPGHAMKWTLIDVTKAKDFEELKTMMAENEKRRNAVIGKALESHISGTGKIIVLVSLQ